MKRVVMGLATVFVALGLGAPAGASPGGLDSNGGHTCHTNCAKFGLSTGQYHCHQAPCGSSASEGTPTTTAAAAPPAASPPQADPTPTSTTVPVLVAPATSLPPRAPGSIAIAGTNSFANTGAPSAAMISIALLLMLVGVRLRVASRVVPRPGRWDILGSEGLRDRLIG